MNMRPYLILGAAVYVAVQLPFCFLLDYFNGSEGVYWQTLRQLQAGRELYADIFYSQWPLFIRLTSLSQFAPFLDLYAARLIVLAFAPLALWATYRLARRWASEKTAAMCVVLVAVDPLFFNLSHQLTGEIPSLASALWAVVLLVEKPLRRSQLLNVTAAAVLFGAAIQLKALMALPLLITGVLWIMFAGGTSRERVKVVAVLFVGSVVTNMLCLYWGGWMAHGGLAQLQGGLVRQFLSSPFSFNMATNLHAVLDGYDYSVGMWMFSLPALLLSLIYLYRRGEQRMVEPLIVASALCLAFFLFYVRVNTDHLIVFTPIVAFAMALVLARQPPGYSFVATVFIAACLLVTAWEFNWTLPQPRKREVRARQALRSVAPQGSVVMGNNLFLITSVDRLTPPEYTDFSAARAVTGSVSCDSIEERLKQGGISAVAMVKKGLEGLPCPGRTIEDVIRTHFPRLAYDDARTLIFF
ncbi:MAG: glycosyltransferase family 39 protein [Bdellovibrionales bacterium]|nr:glycosyltransferase family 39 protein [Bdellovibrionales bacterium]